MVMVGFFFFFFYLFIYLNQSSDGLVVVMAVGGCGWVGLVVVMWGLWVCGLVLARSSNLWVAMVVIGLAVAGCWLLVCWVCGFVHGCSSLKERERDKEIERWRIKK